MNLSSRRSSFAVPLFLLLTAAALVACGGKSDKADAGDGKPNNESKQGGNGNTDLGSGDGGASAQANSSPDASTPKLPPLRVGASAVPHAELIAAVIPELQKQGIDVQVKVFEDYGVPNTAVARGDLDANFFQTEPYLWRWRAAHGGELAVAGRIHIEPMGIWSKKFQTLDAVPSKPGLRVALPNDPANLGRALFLLQKAGLVTLDERKGLDAVVGDITSKERGLKFQLESAEKIARLYDSSDLIVINGNYALEAKLPVHAALLREDETSMFPNVVVALQSKVNDPRIVALVGALKGSVARRFMVEKYGGAVIPAQ